MGAPHLLIALLLSLSPRITHADEILSDRMSQLQSLLEAEFPNYFIRLEECELLIRSGRSVEKGREFQDGGWEDWLTLSDGDQIVQAQVPIREISIESSGLHRRDGFGIYVSDPAYVLVGRTTVVNGVPQNWVYAQSPVMWLRGQDKIAEEDLIEALANAKEKCVSG